MKFTTNLKLFITFFYIYLSLFTEVYTLHSEIQLQRYRRYIAAMRYQRTHTNYPFKTPLANFASGIAEELADGDTGFFQCFPESWRNPNHKESDDPTSNSDDGGSDNGGSDDSSPADGDSQPEGSDGFMDDSNGDGDVSYTTETINEPDQVSYENQTVNEPDTPETTESTETVSESTSGSDSQDGGSSEETSSVKKKIRKSEKKVHDTKIQTKVVENNLGGWAHGLDKFANLAGNVIDFFCKYRAIVINFLQGNFLSRKLRKYRIMVENGNTKRAIALLRKKFGWGWFSRFTNRVKNFARRSWNFVKKTARRVGGAVGNAIKRAAQFVKEKAKAAGAWVKSRILNPIFNRFIKPIRDHIMSFVEKVKKFFMGGIIGRIQTCVNSVKAGLDSVQSVFDGLKEKFDTLRTAISMGLPGIIIYVFDFIIALVCEYKSLIKGIKQLIAGIKSPDKNQKFWLMGKALGTFLRTLATAQTFAGTILSKMRGRKSLF